MLASNTLSHMSWRAVRRTFTTKRSMLIPWLMSFGRVNCKLARAMNAPGDNGTFKSLTLFVTSLSSDVRRVIGQIICLESAKLEYVQDFMKNEPLIQWFTGGDISEIPLYRWRHYRDYSLRQDDGRFGTPCMALALDHEAEEGTGTLRDETYKEHLEYLIRTERVICAGSLHLPTQFKDDPSSLAVGDLVMYNAIDRDEAIELIENDPRAKEGLYKSIQVHFYNNLDVTGKFVAEDELRDSPCADLKEAMEIWGYPVHDDQTPWNNW